MELSQRRIFGNRYTKIINHLCQVLDKAPNIYRHCGQYKVSLAIIHCKIYITYTDCTKQQIGLVKICFQRHFIFQFPL